MRYLFTTAEESRFLSSFMKETTTFDVVVFWENSEEAIEIDNIKPGDQIVFALKGGEIDKIITQALLEKGITEDDIIDFYKIFDLHIPAMAADRVMTNPFYAEYNGIILGLSHAEVGLLSDNFDLPTANLAVSSQDLYYNLKNLQYVEEKYSEKLSDVRYMILEMYKYNYFNYDTSLSKLAIPYYSWGGYDKDPHNLAHNKNVTNSFEEIKQYIFMNRSRGVTAASIDAWRNLFDYDHSKVSKETYSSYYKCIDRSGIISDAEISGYDHNPGTVRNHYKETIEENIGIFNEIIDFAQKKHPGIRVYVLQMPMYKEGWERGKEYYLPWKDEFEKIINDSRREQVFEYHDMTMDDISLDRKCWQDTEHLNYYGALKFTKHINGMVNN